MPLEPANLLALAGLTFLAGTVNGVLGHGFSTVTVPVALLLLVNRLLNPVLVILEVVLNTGSFLANRRAFPAVAPRVLPMVWGLLPGIAVGTAVLVLVPPGPMKLLTYLLLFPVVLVQGLGFRFGLGSERKAALPFGLGTGLLYATTTISGPVLSLYFHDQAYPKDEYRAAISFLRVVESVLTLVAYLALGLVTLESLALAAPLLPGTLLGLGLGAFLATRVAEAGFRRFCVWFNVLAVSYGLARILGPAAPALLRAHLPWALPLAAAALVLTRGFGLLRRSSALPESA